MTATDDPNLYIHGTPSPICDLCGHRIYTIPDRRFHDEGTPMVIHPDHCPGEKN